LTSLDPMSPVPPITTIFIVVSFMADQRIVRSHRSFVFAKTELSGTL
jgi:hypothetical protein